MRLHLRYCFAILIWGLLVSACSLASSDQVSDSAVATEPDTSVTDGDVVETWEALIYDDDSAEAAAPPSVTPAPTAIDPPTRADPGILYDGSVGAASPIEAVDGLIWAINNGDVLGALAFTDPAERNLVAEIYSTLLESSMQEWPQFRGEADVAAQGAQIVPISRLREVPLSDYLTWVETDEIELWMATPTEVGASFFHTDGPWEPEHRDSTSVRERDMDEVSYLFGGDSTDLFPGLVTTKIGGRWFVSFGRTMLEVLRSSLEVEAPFPTERQWLPLERAATADQALLEFVTRMNESRFADAASLLVESEAQALADYPQLLRETFPRVLSVNTKLDASDVVVIVEGEDRAIVEVRQAQIQVMTDDESEFELDDAGTLALADQCFTVGDEERCAATSLYRDEGWEGMRIVAVRDEHGWALSLYETIALVGAPLARNPLYSFTEAADVLLPWNGEAVQGYVLLNEKAKSLPLSDSASFTLEPLLGGRYGLARVIVPPGGGTLTIDPAVLAQEECTVMVWNTSMLGEDWGEEPDYFDSEWCDSYAERPLQLVGGIEMTIWIYGYDEIRFGPVAAAIR